MKLADLIENFHHEEEHHKERPEEEHEEMGDCPAKDLMEALKILEQMKGIEKSEHESEEVGFLDQACLRIKRALMRLQKGM